MTSTTTGAVFRVEESLSTKEGLNKRAVGYGQAFPFQANLPAGYVAAVVIFW